MNTWWDFGSQTDYDLDNLLSRGWMITFLQVVNDGRHEVRVEAERNGFTVWAEDATASKALSQALADVRELPRDL